MTPSGWRPGGVTGISGFHSPVEQECLAVLLRGPAAGHHLPGAQPGQDAIETGVQRTHGGRAAAAHVAV